MSYDDPDLFDPLDPDATLSGHEGVSARDADQLALRQRMMAGDDAGIDVVERLRYHAERRHQSPGRVHWPLMAEAADVIEELRALLGMAIVTLDEHGLEGEVVGWVDGAGMFHPAPTA